jgi:hypothetical protein
LSVLNNQIDAASGTIQLKATFENKDNTLWPGLSVTTRLLVRTLDQALVVPDKAIERGPDGFFVYVVDSQNKAMRHNIKVGPIADGQAVVEAGILPGDHVVTEGQYRLNNGVVVAANNQSPETTGTATPSESSRRVPFPDLSEMTSSSALGQTQITLQFSLSRNIDAAASDVQAAKRCHWATAQRPAKSADLPQDQSGRFADSPRSRRLQ